MVATVQNLADPVAFVLGGDAPYVKWGDLSADERLAVVTGVREWIRGLLGTLPGFKTLQELIEKTCHFKALELELIGQVWEKRCCLVMEIGLGSLGLSCSDGEEIHSQEHYLYTDRDGNWFVGAIFYRLGYFGTTGTPQPRAFRVVCAPISDEQMKMVAETQGRVLYLALKKLLADARGFWEQRMTDAGLIEVRIAQMEGRIV